MKHCNRVVFCSRDLLGASHCFAHNLEQRQFAFRLGFGGRPLEFFADGVLADGVLDGALHATVRS